MEKTMVIKGEGKISAIPDYIIIDLDITNINKNYNAAIDESKLKYDSLLNSLVFLGFKKEDLKTTNFFIETIYENKASSNNDYERIFIGYKIHHQLSLGMNFDMGGLNKVINAITHSTAVPELNIKFTTKDKSAILRELLKTTIDDAKNKADIIMKNLNILLRDIININYALKEFQIFSTTQYMPKMLSDQAINITPSNIELNDDITITWEIENY